MQQRILQKHHQGSCLEYEIDNLYDSHLEGRHIFLSLHALMLLSVLLAYQLILRFQAPYFLFQSICLMLGRSQLLLGNCAATQIVRQTISPHEK